MIDSAVLDLPEAPASRRPSPERAALRRLRLELETAGAVQSRLLVADGPRMATIRYAGSSIAAREVGGDYYDFLGDAPGRLAVGIGDVSGKGISAAILMASLQAHLRSQHTVGRDLRGLIEAVNREFGRSIADSRFATLFFGEYADATRTLRYANAGHGAAILLRAGGVSERLESTGTVLGVLPEWNGSVTQVVLDPGDTILLFTDGITEATDDWGEPFGEGRLLLALRALRHLPPDHLCRALQRVVRRFSPGERSDDRTLVVLHAVATAPDPR